MNEIFRHTLIVIAVLYLDFDIMLHNKHKDSTKKQRRVTVCNDATACNV